MGTFMAIMPCARPARRPIEWRCVAPACSITIPNLFLTLRLTRWEHVSTSTLSCFGYWRRGTALDHDQFRRTRASLSLHYGETLSVRLRLPLSPSPALQALAREYFDDTGLLKSGSASAISESSWTSSARPTIKPLSIVMFWTMSTGKMKLPKGWSWRESC